MDVLGTWTFTDSANESFNVLVHPNGKCVSTWWKGEQLAAGEVGRWRVERGMLHLDWTNGWRDELIASGSMILTASWAPGRESRENPSFTGRAVRINSDKAPHTGVWLSVSSKPGAPVHLALRSDGMAARSSGGNIQFGTWLCNGDATTIIFADGAVYRLVDDGRGTREDVFAAGASPDAKPIATGTATRY